MVVTVTTAFCVRGYCRTGRSPIEAQAEHEDRQTHDRREDRPLDENYR